MQGGAGASADDEPPDLAARHRGGRTESAVMPLSDTLAVQEVLQQAADQLGVAHAEGVVPL